MCYNKNKRCYQHTGYWVHVLCEKGVKRASKNKSSVRLGKKLLQNPGEL